MEKVAVEAVEADEKAVAAVEAVADVKAVASAEAVAAVEVVAAVKEMAHAASVCDVLVFWGFITRKHQECQTNGAWPPRRRHRRAVPLTSARAAWDREPLGRAAAGARRAASTAAVVYLRRSASAASASAWSWQEEASVVAVRTRAWFLLL